MLTICNNAGQLMGSTSRPNGSMAGITSSLHHTPGTSSPATLCVSNCLSCMQDSAGRAGRILSVGPEWKRRALHSPDGNQGLHFYQTDTFALENGDVQGHTGVPLWWSKHATLVFTQTNSFGFIWRFLQRRLTNILGFEYCISFASRKMVMVKIMMRTLWLMSRLNLHKGQCCTSEISPALKGFV